MTKESAVEKGISAGDAIANYNQVMRAGVQVLLPPLQTPKTPKNTSALPSLRAGSYPVPAIAQGVKVGMLKLVYEKPSGRIIGVHILVRAPPPPHSTLDLFSLRVPFQPNMRTVAAAANERQFS